MSEGKKRPKKDQSTKIKFVKGPTLEEEMNRKNAEQETTEDENERTIKRWDYSTRAFFRSILDKLRQHAFTYKPRLRRSAHKRGAEWA